VLRGWQEVALLQQQDRIIISMVGNKIRQRLLWQAWSSWRVRSLYGKTEKWEAAHVHNDGITWSIPVVFPPLFDDL